MKLKNPTKVEIYLQDTKALGKKELIYKNDKYMNKHKIDVVGLLSGKNKLLVKLEDKNKKVEEKELNIRTERLPKMIQTQISSTNKASEDYLLTIHTTEDQNGYLTAYDNFGRVRWYIANKSIGAAGPFTLLKNNHFIVMSGKLNKIPYYNMSAYEMDFMGRIYKEINFQGNGHHDIIELPNNNLLVPVNLKGSKTEEDTLVEYDTTGKIVNVFDFKEILKMYDKTAETLYTEDFFKNNIENAKHDWMHINAVTFNDKNNEIVVSSRHLNALISVDYTTKKINWILADPINNWLSDEHRKKLIVPKEKDFKYTYGQHAVKFLENGNILVYDNGNYSSLYHRGINKMNNSYVPAENISRGLELKIEDGKVEKVWEYIAKNTYTPFIGDINKLGKNHYLINFGGVALLNGKPSDDILACRVENTNDTRIYGKIIEIKDGKVIFEAITSGEKDSSIYRAKKINIYSNVKN